MSDYATPVDLAALNSALATMDLDTGPLTTSLSASAYNVANSGLYRATIREAWLDTRMVQGESRQVIKVNTIATHIDDSAHTGNLYFSVDLITDPDCPYPFAVNLMKSFLCITGCIAQGANGQSTLQLNARTERKPNGTERAVIEALKGVELVVAIRRQESNTGRVFFNPVGFLGSDLRSWHEVRTNAAVASEYKHAFTNLVSEGHPLSPVSTGHSGPVAYGAQAVASHMAPVTVPSPAAAPTAPTAAAPAAGAAPSSWAQSHLQSQSNGYQAYGAPAPAAAAPAQNPYSVPGSSPW